MSNLSLFVVVLTIVYEFIPAICMGGVEFGFISDIKVQEQLGLNSSEATSNEIGMVTENIINSDVYANSNISVNLTKIIEYNNGHLALKFTHKFSEQEVTRGDFIIYIDEIGNPYASSGFDILVEPNAQKSNFPRESLKNTALYGMDEYINPRIQSENEIFYRKPGSNEIIPAVKYEVIDRDVGEYSGIKVIFNATTGEIIEQSPLVWDALDREIYDYDFDTTPKPTIPVRGEGDPAVGTEADDAYDNAEYAFDFFQDEFGWDGIDGEGGTVKVFVNYGSLTNAYYSTNDEITLGGGTCTGSFSESPDILVHEYGHGVLYHLGVTGTSGEPAALHESWGDTMACLADISIGEPAADHWVLGDIMCFAYQRFLDDPSRQWFKGVNDHYSEYSGYSHQDSGIPSLAFYLTAVGGDHPRGDTLIVVNGCGVSTASRVLWDAAETYVSYETMGGAAEKTVLTALNDYGYSECCSFASSWYAVGVEDAFWHPSNSEWEISYMGWIYFDEDSYFMTVGQGGWYTYTTYDSDDGAMNIYSYDTQSYYYTSAESFPLYWDYTTSNWDTYNGEFI